MIQYREFVSRVGCDRGEHNPYKMNAEEAVRLSVCLSFLILCCLCVCLALSVCVLLVCVCLSLSVCVLLVCVCLSLFVRHTLFVSSPRILLCISLTLPYTLCCCLLWCN